MNFVIHCSVIFFEDLSNNMRMFNIRDCVCQRLKVMYSVYPKKPIFPDDVWIDYLESVFEDYVIRKR